MQKFLKTLAVTAAAGVGLIAVNMSQAYAVTQTCSTPNVPAQSNNGATFSLADATDKVCVTGNDSIIDSNFSMFGMTGWI